MTDSEGAGFQFTCKERRLNGKWNDGLRLNPIPASGPYAGRPEDRGQLPGFPPVAISARGEEPDTGIKAEKSPGF